MTHIQPRRKSKVPLVLGIIAAVLLVICGTVVACVALVGNAVEDATNNSATVGMNQAARDGKFEFTVTKVECGIATIGSEPLLRQPQGQFCKVSVTVKNIGDEAQPMFATNQYAYNAANQRYDADPAGGAYLDEPGAQLIYESINPGNSVAGVILFDIPKDATIVRLELHDSLLSGGVTVNLAGSSP